MFTTVTSYYCCMGIRFCLSKKGVYINFKLSIKQIQSIEDVQELRQFVGENFDVISECGFTKASSRLSPSTDRIDLVHTVT